METAATYQSIARGRAAVSSETEALDRHRAAVRARLLSTGAVRADAGTISWKVNREVIVIIGWARAILLLLAHPLIAAGVGDHSEFRRSLLTSFKRLGSTITAMLSLTFGTDEEAIDTAASINSIHDRVSGRLGEPAGTLDANAHYSAHDPELLRWVHATLLDSVLLTYERLVGRLTTEERDRYCAEAAIMEPLLDIPAGLLPRDAAQLDAYVQATLASSQIVVAARSRALARAILFPPGWRLLWPVFRPVQLLTIGLLPQAIRQGYGFTWTARDDRALTRWSAALRLLHGTIPRFVREWPAARRRNGQTTQSHSVSSAGPLEIGLQHPLHVREERLSTRDAACRLLYVSDIHLRNGRSDTLCRQVLDAVTRARPDAVLLGGDMVDTASELNSLRNLLVQLRDVAPVYAIGGNHDSQVGLDLVREAIVNGGGQWINDGSARLTHRGRVITISGPESPAPVDGDVRVLCAHDPRIWKTARDAGYDLVLAGHLHGCQLVACEYRDRLFPGAIFYPYCFLNHHIGSARLVVSRGVSDLLPIRWRCPREVVLCHV